MNDGTKIKILNIPLSKNSLCVLEKIDEANRDWTRGNDRVLITRHMKGGKKKKKKRAERGRGLSTRIPPRVDDLRG